MARKRYSPEQIIGYLREAEILQVLIWFSAPPNL